MSNLEIIKTTPDMIDRIMPVYDAARRFMRLNGNMNQWAGGYPSAEVILGDIAKGNHYTGLDADGRIAMVFTFIIGDDPTYSHIDGRGWLNDRPYGTIHRIASSGLCRSMLDKCVAYCLTRIDNLRIDTHADNRPMLAAIERNGFTRCGIIRLADGSPRTAFHLVCKDC